MLGLRLMKRKKRKRKKEVLPFIFLLSVFGLVSVDPPTLTSFVYDRDCSSVVAVTCESVTFSLRGSDPLFPQHLCCVTARLLKSDQMLPIAPSICRLDGAFGHKLRGCSADAMSFI